MDLNEIYFPVEKVPVDTIMPGYEHPSGLRNAIVVTKPDGAKRVVKYASDIYHLVPNQTVVDPFIAHMGRFFEVEPQIKMRNWASFEISVLLKDRVLTIQKDDGVFPRITLINSYDGSRKYQFNAGFYRLICSNGLTVPVGAAQIKLKRMHTPHIEELTSFEAVIEMAHKFMEVADIPVELYRELASQDVPDVNERVEEVLEETTFPKTLGEDVLYRASEEMEILGLKMANDWLVYNAFNYQLNHNDGLKAKESKKEAIDEDIVEYLLNY